MTRKQRRLTLVAAAGVVLAASLGLALTALNDQIVFFYTPSDLAAKTLAPDARVRLGGLVEAGSVTKAEDGRVTFTITDTAETVPVRYQGLLPDLFREGQGVVAEGRIGPDGALQADTVLAKHDETYMPREVAEALKEKGVWQGDGPPPTHPASAAPVTPASAPGT